MERRLQTAIERTKQTLKKSKRLIAKSKELIEPPRAVPLNSSRSHAQCAEPNVSVEEDNSILVSP